MKYILFLGGNIAVVVERRLRHDKHMPRIRGILLYYPLLQFANLHLPSYSKYLSYRLLSLLHEDILTQVINFYINTSFTKHQLFNNQYRSLDNENYFYSKLNLINSHKDYFRQDIDRNMRKLFDENISPLLADDEILRHSPSTYICACTYDVLLSDAQLYYQRLKKLNVDDIIYKEYLLITT